MQNFGNCNPENLCSSHPQFPADDFDANGFAIFQLLTSENFALLKKFVVEVLQNLFHIYAHRSVSEEDLLLYHLWGKQEKIPHAEMLKAKNRHLQPSVEIEQILLNGFLDRFLAAIGIRKYKLWDEGLGWLAFRLIRPGPGDGYPFSCKNWGPAKGVYSFWIPIFGFDPNLMIHLIPGSHTQEHPRYLPSDTHFTKDEYRLASSPSPDACLRPKMQPGEALCFHPKTLHAEEVSSGSCTRCNIEFRVLPCE